MEERRRGQQRGAVTMTVQVNDFNRGIIEEFRANEGRVGGPFEGSPVTLLHSIGAKSGLERVNPVVFQRLDDGHIAVFASKGGAPSNPDWYRNLVANPEAMVEVGAETYAVRARTATGDEREGIWAKQKEDFPGFADYERRTTRQIPVVVLERV
jgi:deazaflavin-dependent oxidoreductase (nitroreductase family)